MTPLIPFPYAAAFVAFSAFMLLSFFVLYTEYKITKARLIDTEKARAKAEIERDAFMNRILEKPAETHG
jgi:hypothetical protein